MNPNLKNKGKV